MEFQSVCIAVTVCEVYKIKNVMQISSIIIA